MCECLGVSEIAGQSGDQKATESCVNEHTRSFLRCVDLLLEDAYFLAVERSRFRVIGMIVHTISQVKQSVFSCYESVKLSRET